MKYRPMLFLSEENIKHDSEIFSYIQELHDYLWKFVRVAYPSAGGNLDWYVDKALEKLSTPNSDKFTAQAQAILETLKDKNYPAARDLTITLFTKLSAEGYSGGYRIEWDSETAKMTRDERRNLR